MKGLYVYIIFRLNGVPCYVGMGKNDRWREHFRTKTNPYLSKIIKKEGQLPVVLIRSGLSREEAIETEIALIAAIGRKDLGTGPLVNMTVGGDGGEAFAGHKHSDEAKALMSSAAKLRGKRFGWKHSEQTRTKIASAAKLRVGDRNSFSGRTHTEETRRKNREAHLGKSSFNKGLTGELSHWYGRRHSEETKSRMRAAWEKRRSCGSG